MKKNYYDVKFSLSDIMDERKFVVPQYQRGLAWDHQRRDNFIRNIRNGDPFGIILVRAKNDKYELIDGLQRISTIKHYKTNPFVYLSIDDISEELSKELVLLHLSNQNLTPTDKFIQDLTFQVKLEVFNCLKNKKENFEAMDIVMNKLSITPSNNLKRKINEIYEDFNSKISIDNIEVLAINYVGPEENIPNLFYNLNTGGVALSKFDTYAALWSRTLFKIEDKDLLSHVEKKYTSVVDESGLELSFDIESIYEDGITLFEYCYALSEYIINSNPKYNLFFKKISKKDQVSPVGFELLTLISGLPVNKTEDLYEVFKHFSNRPDFLLQIKDVIIDSLDKAVNTLESSLKTLNNVNLVPESNYQIYHYLLSIIKNEYIIDIKNGNISPNPEKIANKTFKKYSSEVFVYDIIRDFWKLNRQVSDLGREINSFESRQRYWSCVNVENWKVAVDYFVDSLNVNRKTIPMNVKVFINYYIKLKVSSDPAYLKFIQPLYLENKSLTFDFSNVIPIKVLENKTKTLTPTDIEQFPFSSIGNLSFVTIKETRLKNIYTLHQFYDKKFADKLDMDFLNFSLYPSEEDLDFLDNDEEHFISKYKKLIVNREFLIKEDFIRLVESN